MTKRPNTLASLRIALDLIERIPRDRKITATELHRQLLAAGHSRDLRTVQRQLEMLSAHFDVERDDRDKPFGYRRKPPSPTAPEADGQPTRAATPAVGETRQRNLLHAISDALCAGRWLELDYRDAGDPPLPDKVGPLGLTWQGTDLYLVYAVHNPSRIANLALDRIVAARVTHIPFERPHGFRLQRPDAAEPPWSTGAAGTPNEQAQPGIHQ